MTSKTIYYLSSVRQFKNILVIFSYMAFLATHQLENKIQI